VTSAGRRGAVESRPCNARCARFTPPMCFGVAQNLLVLLHGSEIERPLAIVMVGGLATSTLFTLLAGLADLLPTGASAAGALAKPPGEQ
jgi:hypothetical protein